MRTVAALALLTVLTGCQQRAVLPQLSGVASIDYCADQMVLGLLPPQKVKAVSFETDSDAAFAAPRAAGIARLRPQLEDIAALRPAVVVRSYGGSPRIDRELRAMGIRVVQLGFPGTLSAVRKDVLRVGGELGAADRARALVGGFDRQLAEAAIGSTARGSALYITPGDVTTGPGSLVAEVMRAAGYVPYRATPGWGSLPLETMVRHPPDMVFRAFFDSQRYRQDHWASSRHPVVAKAVRTAGQVEVPGAWLACGNWLSGYAVTALANGSGTSK